MPLEMDLPRRVKKANKFLYNNQKTRNWSGITLFPPLDVAIDLGVSRALLS